MDRISIEHLANEAIAHAGGENRGIVYAILAVAKAIMILANRLHTHDH